MSFIDRFFGKKGPKAVESFDPNARHQFSQHLFSSVFDGEKTPGEIGLAKNYVLDHDTLRARGWQFYLDSEITQTVINRFVTWVVGKGLKLEAEPIEEILESEGIKLDFNQFSKAIESRFKVYSNSRVSDHAGLSNIHKNAVEAYKNAIVSGDCLTILRIKNGNVTTEIIDGVHIVTPTLNSALMKAAKD